MRRFMMVLVLSLPAFAGQTTIDVTTRVTSDYCWSLGGHTGHPALQGSATVSTSLNPGLSVFGGSWCSYGAGKFGREVDLYAGLTGRTGRNGRDRWTLTGFWYDLHPVGTEGHGDMVEIAGRYEHPFSRRFTGALGLRWMQPVGHTPPGRPMPYLEGCAVLPLARRDQLVWRERISYDSGIFGGDAGWLSRTTLSLTHRIGFGTIDLSLDLSAPLAGIRDRTDRVIVSTGWSGTF